MVIAAEALRPLTIDDLASFPDDGKRREIITGELVVTPAPTPRHQALVGRLHRKIGNFVEDKQLGEAFPSPVDVRLSANDVVEPDIVYVSYQAGPPIAGRFIDRVPLLVVEVLSPSTRRVDLVRKRALYARAGIREYWIVDPDNETVSVNLLQQGVYVTLVGEKSRVSSEALPGLEIDLTWLFSNLPLEE